MNNRRKLIITLAAAVLASPLSAFAQQQGKVWRIGFLGGGSASSFESLLSELRQGLRDHGYVESRNVAFEYRYADGVYGRLPVLVDELIHLKVDLIVTEGTPSTLAAKQATSSIPIVMAQIGDPVATGVVASLAKPGGNITGSSSIQTELDLKRLEILKETVPRLTCVAVLLNRNNPLHQFDPLASAVHTLGLELEPVWVGSAEEIPVALTAVVRETRADGLLVRDDAMFRNSQKTIADFALKNKLPNIFGSGTQAAAGGLMNYGPDRQAMYRQAAVFIDKIFKGAKPSELPVEQPIRFEFIINLQTAKTLGL
ncbi:MAG: ABC transporter substrate-binding protein, partial [Pseudomonadota bacterium]